MVIEKVININIVSAYDEDGREVVIMGRGIGFGVKPGARIRESKIEKIFRIESRSVAEQLKELLAHMPLETCPDIRRYYFICQKYIEVKTESEYLRDSDRSYQFRDRQV